MDAEQRSGCPINLAVEVLGDRWSLVVIRDMMFGNRRHFRELLTGTERLNLAVHRAVSDRNALAREFSEAERSPVFRSNGTRLPRPDRGRLLRGTNCPPKRENLGRGGGCSRRGRAGEARGGKLGLRQAASDREARQGTSGLSSGLGSHSNIRSLNFIVDTSVHVI